MTDQVISEPKPVLNNAEVEVETNQEVSNIINEKIINQRRIEAFSDCD